MTRARSAISLARAVTLTLTLVLVLVLVLATVSIALRPAVAHADTGTSTLAHEASLPPGRPRAPSRPPLLPGGASTPTTVGSEEDQGLGAEGESDPLVSNGLASPTCKGPLAAELTAANRSHCETSGFIAAPAPTGDYGIDVHIDNGFLGIGVASVVQNLMITPLWMLLVWVVHALVVMVEWCFTIDLLDSAPAGQLAMGLRQAQRSFTDPWLALALALASMVAAYQGLIRRRVADTLGEVLLMAAMMVAGLWIIADPAGTVGALGEWANEASLGTLAVAAAGTPSAPARALDARLDTVFATAIEGPWCYLEFGNVGWCREPSRLDPSLRSAGLAIAAQEIHRAGCGSSSACAVAGGGAQALAHSAQLLREARSNGAIFLALPANGPARNAISEEGSLLRALCDSSELNSCHGATAAEADFRTAGQTIPRAGGLMLIAVGLLGMLLLLGFLGLRLLLAAIFALLYLLFAPAIVLAPAFGESGRALFRKWAAQLLGAVVSKLLFSFLLGVVLAVLSVLSDLTAIGWWTQWLLTSAFWWGAFLHRHQALGAISAGVGHERAPRRSVVRGVNSMLENRAATGAVAWVKKRKHGAAPEVSERSQTKTETESREQRSKVAGQAEKSLKAEYHYANAQRKHSSVGKQRIAGLRTRLEHVRMHRSQAMRDGDLRRATSLANRSASIEHEIERERVSLADTKRIAKATSMAYVRDNSVQRERFLDEQATLPSSRQRLSTLEPGTKRRDYQALAGLAGHAPEEYLRLQPREQREARMQIDRELALRKQVGAELVAGTGVKAAGAGAVNDAGADAVATRANTAQRASRSPSSETGIDPELIDAANRSPVMRDAFDVAAGRKRQLGSG